LKIQPELDKITRAYPLVGTFPLPELLRFTGEMKLSGLAVMRDNERAIYLAVIAGEPEGAVYADENGELYGDKAIVRLTGKEQYALHDTGEDLARALVMGCRIFEKSHLKMNLSSTIPEFGRRSDGIGVLVLTVSHNAEPQNGYRVSVRKDGRIVGSDVTTEDGSVRFRLMYGEYDCIVQDRAGSIFPSRVIFDESHAVQTLAV
jgi:hypothetical protein